MIHGNDTGWLESNNTTDNNTMIGFRWGRRLYQEITGYVGFYTLTFDLVKRSIGYTDEPNINVLINMYVEISIIYNLIPIKLMNPRAIKPVIIKVMPKPFRGAGTFEYAIFSLIAAIATIAKNHPTPEPNP